MSYAGDIPCADAWKRLADDPSARLVDVRTQAEWAFVGVPDLSSLAKEPLLVQWQVFPSMTRNESFADHLAMQAIHPGDTLLFLCRSGVRSKAAAEVMTAMGYESCWNIIDGFEGPHDNSRHRGLVGGWKASGLPWTQG